MESYHLCTAWNWEHDADFVLFLEEACSIRELSLLEISPVNLDTVLKSLYDSRITFESFIDRASDEDLRFMPLVEWARDHARIRINPFETAIRTWNKAHMHSVLINAGIYTPYTFILPPFEKQPDLPPLDLSPLQSKSFTLKPAHGGGGKGVVVGATSFKQVQDARQEFPTDEYLVQTQILPVQLGSKTAYFRIICCNDRIYPCWWDIDTHVYAPLTSEDETQFSLTPLWNITRTISQLSGLHLFSTEIALTADGNFVVVDYVNDQIDLRIQSKAHDGVPDHIVRDIAHNLVSIITNHLQKV